ncbi:putative transmembrane protein [Toxoplasma gondii VEG]|uniref:Transmembrane protein n=2 Tax=Toxoplasma gondii TaxID=5811 RepID=B9QAZ6_TOXGV|nr:putative transmembrane protein [Toxoplasma gondii VEG]KFG39663.1 putative transmembrane protein [Toxoplasma gondii p89]
MRDGTLLASTYEAQIDIPISSTLFAKKGSFRFKGFFPSPGSCWPSPSPRARGLLQVCRPPRLSVLLICVQTLESRHAEPRHCIPCRFRFSRTFLNLSTFRLCSSGAAEQPRPNRDTFSFAHRSEGVFVYMLTYIYINTCVYIWIYTYRFELRFSHPFSRIFRCPYSCYIHAYL